MENASVHQLFNPEGSDRVVDSLIDLFFRQSPVLAAKSQLSGSIDIVELGARILENSSHKSCCIIQFHIPDFFPFHKNGPFCLSLIKVRDQAVDQAKYRCLPAPGRSGQQHKFSILDRQIDSAKTVFCPILILCSTVTECHIFQFYHNLTPHISRIQAQTTKRHPTSIR